MDFKPFSQLSNNQFGFRKNKSTEAAILKFTNEIYTNMKRKSHVV